jgi:hypothetical protein
VRLQTAASAKGKEDAKEEGEKEAESGSGSEDEEEWNEGPGIGEMLRDIVREKGISGACCPRSPPPPSPSAFANLPRSQHAGLWSGFPTAMLLSSSPALTFYVSALLTRAAIPRARRAAPSAAQVFVVNALGSSVSTMVLYPLILSKSRLMWRSPSGRRQYTRCVPCPLPSAPPPPRASIFAEPPATR